MGLYSFGFERFLQPLLFLSKRRELQSPNYARLPKMAQSPRIHGGLGQLQQAHQIAGSGAVGRVGRIGSVDHAGSVFHFLA
jgi:hypothetical protein